MLQIAATPQLRAFVRSAVKDSLHGVANGRANAARRRPTLQCTGPAQKPRMPVISDVRSLTQSTFHLADQGYDGMKDPTRITENRETLRAASVGSCIYCGATDQLTDEHIIPLALGGRFVLPDSSCAKYSSS